MARRLNVDRPVRCGRCGVKFVRRNGREKLCVNCKPAYVRARLAAERPVVPVPAVKVSPGPLKAEREQSVKLALKLARQAAGADGIADHARTLIVYARSVARGVVPGRMWQLTRLGFAIPPCDGEGNPYLLPRPDGPETLAEARFRGACDDPS